MLLEDIYNYLSKQTDTAGQELFKEMIRRMLCRWGHRGDRYAMADDPRFEQPNASTLKCRTCGKTYRYALNP